MIVWTRCVGRLVLALLCAVPGAIVCGQEKLPEFRVPGQDAAMKALNELHALHHERAFTPCTLWDAWLPRATLWASEKKREQYRQSLLARAIDQEGYVSMQQHRGMAHSEGWPFPAWQQSGGIGFHFSTAGDAWAIKNFRLKPLTSTEGWEIEGADVIAIDPAIGLRLQATEDTVKVTTPAFQCGTIVAPFARIEWAARGLSDQSTPRIQWLLEGETQWQPKRSGTFAPLRPTDGMSYANVPLYRQPGYNGVLTRYRVSFDRASGAEITLKSIITAIDTRHPITGSLFVRGCADYFCWTGDVDFLRQSMGRMRQAMRYTLDEFSVRQRQHVFVPWVGHDGRSGLVVQPDGSKTARPGHGVGNNYWDLLPFGAHDAMATMYVYDALLALAQIEQAARSITDWAVPVTSNTFDPEDLSQLAADIRTDFQQRFWCRETGRFVGWVDVEGHAYDYGFTFVNLEAIHYGLASTRQARSIYAWLDAKRDVAADTSRGVDIYRWRFAPRATTRRNVETYVWPWFNPEQIPWGNQVQDGGAVLGFSYFDLMSRLKTNGPDDAWRRLQEILVWFREVQDEGGYRAYYAKPGRGTLQGGGPPGGLGLDREFLESVLVPQVMLYGFMGVEPSPEGIRVAPRLPQAWPALTITGIRFQDHVFDLRVDAQSIDVLVRQPGASELKVLQDDQERRPVKVQSRRSSAK